MLILDQNITLGVNVVSNDVAIGVHYLIENVQLEGIPSSTNVDVVLSNSAYIGVTYSEPLANTLYIVSADSLQVGVSFTQPTAESVPIVYNATADSLQVGVTFNSPTAVSVAAGLPTGNIILYLPFDNSIVDGTGLNTITSNGISYVNGIFSGNANEAVYYNSIDDYVQIANNSRFNFGNGTTDNPFSITTSIELSVNQAFRWLLAKRGQVGDPAVDREWQLLTDNANTGKIRFDILDQSTGGFIGRQGNTSLVIGTPYNIAVTYDGSGLETGIKIYINGVEETTYTNNSTGVYTAMEAFTSPIRSGSQIWDNGSRALDTELEDIAIWDIELSGSQASDVYDKAFNGEKLLV